MKETGPQRGQAQDRRTSTIHTRQTRARDYKETSSMDWCSTHDFVLNEQSGDYKQIVVRFLCSG